METTPRLLLVAPPWRMPYTGSLALATLRPIVEAAGFAIDELHGSVYFPPVHSDYDVLEAYAKFLFVPELTGCDVEAFLDEVMLVLLDKANMEGILVPRDRVTFDSVGVDEKLVRQRLRNDIAGARVCLDRCVERALAVPYDVIGFSVTFDDQVPAALAIARRVKRARPDVRIIFGGAACFEEQADGLVTSFPEIDVVCHTEGENVIVPLLAALRGARALDEVPGIAYRDATGALRHQPAPPLVQNLDELPIPDYRDFMRQLLPTEWALIIGARLMFETSRGCWWGQKQLCTFCGLNAEGLAFRAKSPERAYEEIRTLYEAYPQATYFQATDNILDMHYLSTVFPRLTSLAQAPHRPLKMFYEVKSNMKREQVEAMAAGGVNCVQPGIESFSDEVLSLMRKGCTALGQIQFLKWAAQSGIEPLYNIILCNPGERVEWYDAMMELLPFLEHLPPPTGITPMMLERFSPYHLHPQEFGIANVRPKSSYRLLYPDPGVDLDRIAYQFDFDHELQRDPKLQAAYRSISAAMTRWRKRFKEDMAFFVDEGTHFLVVDRRQAEERRHVVGGLAAQIFAYLDQHRTRRRIGEQFPMVDEAFIDCLLLTWLHRRWICRDGNDRWLAVLPRKGPAQMKVEPWRAERPLLRVVGAAPAA